MTNASDHGSRLIRIDRRTCLAAAISGTAIAALFACSENTAIGRRQFALVPDDMLAQMSAQAWSDILATVPRARDERLHRRLTTIGERMALASGLAGLEWEFVVFDSADINAFVLPGGKVGFFRGLIDLTASDGEVAAVMGHEIGHVMARHASERVSQQLAVQLGVEAARVALSEDLGEHADDAAAALGAGLIYGVVLPYSRTHELEADRLGVGVMARGSYEPRAALQFWEKMVAANAGRAQPLPWMSTHPANEERLAALRALV